MIPNRCVDWVTILNHYQLSDSNRNGFGNGDGFGNGNGFGNWVGKTATASAAVSAWSRAARLLLVLGSALIGARTAPTPGSGDDGLVSVGFFGGCHGTCAAGGA